MSKVVGTALLALLFLNPSTEGLAEEWLDQTDLNRLKCLEERASAGLSNKPECYDRTRDGQFWEARRQELCSNPSQFCRSVTELSAKDATAKLVNSSCQTIVFPKALTSDELGAKSASNIDLVSADRGLATAMRDYWGCSPGTSAGGSSKFSCSKLPCVKSSGTKTNFSSNRMAELRQMYGVSAKPESNGSCTIEMPGDRAMRFFINSQAAMPGSEAASIKDEALGPGKEKKELLKQRARQMLKAFYTGDRLKTLKKASDVARRSMIKALDGTSPKPPQMIYDMVKNTRVLDNPEEIAKDDGLLLEMVEICGLDKGFGSRTAAHTDASTVHKHGSSSHVIICPMNLIEAERNGPEALVDTFSHEFGHAIGPCAVGQNLVIKAQKFRKGKTGCPLPGKSDPDGADFAFFTEQMRPFRSCLYNNSTLGPSQTSPPECTFASGDNYTTPSADYPRIEQCRENGKCSTVKSPEGEIVFTTCLQQGPQVRRRSTLSGSPAGQLPPNERILFGLFMNERIGAGRHGDKACEFKETPPGDPCSCFDLAQHDVDPIKDTVPIVGSGLVSSCNKTSIALTAPEVKEGIKDLIRPIDKVRMQNDQSEEAMADYWGSLATGYAAQDPDCAYPNKKERNSPDAVLDTVATYATRCRMPSFYDDSHPNPRFRVTLYASDPKFRSYLGCSPTPPANSPNFPSTACSMSKPKAP